MMWFILVLFMLLACWFFLNEIVRGFINIFIYVVVHVLLDLLCSGNLCADTMSLYVPVKGLMLVFFVWVIFRFTEGVDVEKKSNNRISDKTMPFLEKYGTIIVWIGAALLAGVMIESSGPDPSWPGG